jgi:hypothetical protein
MNLKLGLWGTHEILKTDIQGAVFKSIEPDSSGSGWVQWHAIIQRAIHPRFLQKAQRFLSSYNKSQQDALFLKLFW